jgi:hypothetical protein
MDPPSVEPLGQDAEITSVCFYLSVNAGEIAASFLLNGSNGSNVLLELGLDSRQLRTLSYLFGFNSAAVRWAKRPTPPLTISLVGVKSLRSRESGSGSLMLIVPCKTILAASVTVN